MIYWILQSFSDHPQLLLRAAGAALVSWLIVMLAAPSLIRFLVRKKIGDRPEFDHADLNELAKRKSDTPTMGGVLIVSAVVVATILFGDLSNRYVLMGLFALVWLGLLGAVDDWFKIRRAAGETSRDGLKSWQKILFQIGLAVLLSIFIRRYGSQSFVPGPGGAWENPPHNFYLPLKAAPIYLPMLAYVIITVLTMVGSSNAVNLTDGMDGLAAGCLIIVAAFFLMVSWLVGVEPWARLFQLPHVYGSKEMAVLCASILGACLGFLWYNAGPASIFMGDTGSLPLGGLIGYVAVVTRQELTLVIAGGVFVMEALSVVLQVGYFKLTRPGPGRDGKRLFRCAPIHHHFHLGGWAENKVVVRLWILGIIFAALALATLKLR